MERRLAVIMSIDVAGYSRLMEADEAGTLARLSDIRRDVIDPLTAAHDGRTVKLMGDGALMEFASVVEAVGFALEMQRAMAAANDGAARTARIDYRVGINLGDIVVEADDIYGDGVNVAARLEALAEPGGILISGTVYDHVKSKLDCGFEFQGERQVKNIEEPVRLYKVLPDAGNALKGAAGARTRKTAVAIALRPFQVRGGDAALTGLAEAFSEDLEIALSQLRTLRVRAAALPGAEERTGADYLLKGSVRPRGDGVRVNAQVIHVQSGYNVWAERYDRPLADMEDGADALVEAIAASTQTQIALHEGAAEKQFSDERERVEHLAAQGWAAINRFSEEGMNQAEKLCAAALSLDPDSARAHLVLATALHHQYYMGFTREPAETLRRGMAHIDRSIALNDEDEYAHWTRGNILCCARDTSRALAALARSREINPAFSLGVASTGTTCAWAGRSAEAISGSEQALAANPKDPSNFFRYNTIAVAHFADGDYAKALNWAEKTLERRRRFLPPHLIRVAAAAHLGRDGLSAMTAEMLEAFPHARDLGPDLAPFARDKDREALGAGLALAFG